MFRTTLVHHQGAHQSLHKTIMIGLVVHVEELLVICHVVDCYTVDKSSVCMIQGCSRLALNNGTIIARNGKYRKWNNSRIQYIHWIRCQN